MLGSECEEAAVGGGPCVDRRAGRKPAPQGGALSLWPERP